MMQTRGLTIRLNFLSRDEPRSAQRTTLFSHNFTCGSKHIHCSYLIILWPKWESFHWLCLLELTQGCVNLLWILCGAHHEIWPDAANLWFYTWHWTHATEVRAHLITVQSISGMMLAQKVGLQPRLRNTWLFMQGWSGLGLGCTMSFALTLCVHVRIWFCSQKDECNLSQLYMLVCLLSGWILCMANDHI